MNSKQKAWEEISGLKLIDGGGTIEDYKERQRLCVMQAYNVYYSTITGNTNLVGEYSGSSGLQYHNIPEVCPLVEAYMIGVNDSSCSEAQRQQLLAYVPRLLHSDKQDLVAYRQKQCDNAVRQYARKAWDGDKHAQEIMDSAYWNLSDKTDYSNWEEYLNEVNDQMQSYSSYEVLSSALGAHDFPAALRLLDKFLNARDRKAERSRRKKKLAKV